jgi:type 1 fimbria pilin
MDYTGEHPLLPGRVTLVIVLLVVLLLALGFAYKAGTDHEKPLKKESTTFTVTVSGTAGETSCTVAGGDVNDETLEAVIAFCVQVQAAKEKESK